MKTFGNFVSTLAIMGALVLCASGARATSYYLTTNYDVLNITATITTNIEKTSTSNIDTCVAHTFTLNNASILSMLEGPDWNNGTFPAGSKLVVSWDSGHSFTPAAPGDILVVDKSGTNVLYDASLSLWSFSGQAFMTVDFHHAAGADSENENTNAPGHYDTTRYNITSFQILDGVTGLSISTTGPSTEISTQGWDKNGDYTSWTDSVHASTYGAGANQVINGYANATVSVTISAGGHGPGVGGWFYLNDL
jgi:hypothetical protein